MALGLILLVSMIFVVFFGILATVAYLVNYLGYMDEAEALIRDDPPEQYKKLKFVAKRHTGAFKESGEHFTSTLGNHKNCSTIGVYLDSPGKVDAEDLRYLIGSIVPEDCDDFEPAEGFETFEITDIGHCVTSEITYNDSMSIKIKLKNAYHEISRILLNKMIYKDLTTFIEIYPHATTEIQIIGDLSASKEIQKIKDGFTDKKHD